MPQPVDLAEVAGNAVTETERANPGVLVERSGEFPEVPGSAVLLRRALVNLLRNACEATPEARRADRDAIELCGVAADAEVTLSVADRGPGVGAGAREKIFLPFYSSKPNGSGLGLAIVARIAQLHGGTVTVDDRPGGGAVFALRLPRS